MIIRVVWLAPKSEWKNLIHKFSAFFSIFYIFIIFFGWPTHQKCCFWDCLNSIFDRVEVAKIIDWSFGICAIFDEVINDLNVNWGVKKFIRELLFEKFPSWIIHGNSLNINNIYLLIFTWKFREIKLENFLTKRIFTRRNGGHKNYYFLVKNRTNLTWGEWDAIFTEAFHLSV